MPQFQCTVCLDDADEVSPHAVGPDRICHECSSTRMVDLIQQAAQFEHHYPVRWGNGRHRVKVSDFADVLPEGVLATYYAREVEYKTPAAVRAYCSHQTPILTSSDGQPSKSERCGEFLGQKAGERSYWTCPRCRKPSCRRCGTAFGGPYDGHAGECDRLIEQANADAAADDQAAFQGQVRGRDYQICPNAECGRRIYLGEACNRMVCPQPACRTVFCFICGGPVEPDHFAVGKPCPHWNQPGSANAIYDGPPVQIDIDMDVGEESRRLHDWCIHLLRTLPAISESPGVQYSTLYTHRSLRRIHGMLGRFIMVIYRIEVLRQRAGGAPNRALQRMGRYFISVWKVLRVAHVVVCTRSEEAMARLAQMQQTEFPPLADEAEFSEAVRNFVLRRYANRVRERHNDDDTFDWPGLLVLLDRFPNQMENMIVILRLHIRLGQLPTIEGRDEAE